MGVHVHLFYNHNSIYSDSGACIYLTDKQWTLQRLQKVVHVINSESRVSLRPRPTTGAPIHPLPGSGTPGHQTWQYLCQSPGAEPLRLLPRVLSGWRGGRGGEIWPWKYSATLQNRCLVLAFWRRNLEHLLLTKPRKIVFGKPEKLPFHCLYSYNGVVCMYAQVTWVMWPLSGTRR